MCDRAELSTTPVVQMCPCTVQDDSRRGHLSEKTTVKMAGAGYKSLHDFDRISRTFQTRIGKKPAVSRDFPYTNVSNSRHNDQYHRACF